MIRRFAQLLIAACVLLAAASPAMLRAEPAAENPPVQFSCVVWEPLPFPEVFYRDGKNYLPLEFSPGNRSRLYSLKEAPDLQLYVKVVGADNEVIYRLVGMAPLLEGTRRILFFIDPVTKSTGLPLRIFGVDDALDVFPPGSFRFVNSASAALKVKFGGQTTQLPADEIKVVKSNVSTNGGFLPFLIVDANGKPVFETRLFSQPTGRDMVFISPPAKRGDRMLVKLLPQLIAPEPPKTPPGE